MSTLFLFHDGRGRMDEEPEKRVGHMTHTTVHRMDCDGGRFRCVLRTGHEVNVDEEGAHSLVNLGIAAWRESDERR